MIALGETLSVSAKVLDNWIYRPIYSGIFFLLVKSYATLDVAGRAGINTFTNQN